MEIRAAKKEDAPRIMEIYDIGRRFMREHGNATQWDGGYPSRELVEEDIESGICHVCVDNGNIEGVFAFFIGTDPTYEKIYNGEWLDAAVGGVVHRIASSGNIRGVGSFCIRYACDRCDNLRIDTHADNYVMQGMLEKNGFCRCGIIYLPDSSPRIAYQRVNKNA
jgi:hypothetical protein